MYKARLVPVCNMVIPVFPHTEPVLSLVEFGDSTGLLRRYNGYVTGNISFKPIAGNPLNSFSS
jgi:hypothetical protein